MDAVFVVWFATLAQCALWSELIKRGKEWWLGEASPERSMFDLLHVPARRPSVPNPPSSSYFKY